ncbi:hypothetical protein VTN31DRAFT_5087 [Thermomyces dupontii]|uniref:uncharacterized protein n=1 Tax=Talaromyces thermophilus TaxID=28565 RepID=UPI0037420EA7
MFPSTFDLSFNDVFNQYVNADSPSVGAGNKDANPLSGDLDPLFPLGSLSTSDGDLSPLGSQQFLQSSSYPWHKSPWCSQRESPLPRPNSGFHDSVHPAESSEASLNLDSSTPPESACILSTSPSSPPETPNRKLFAQRSLESLQSAHRREANDRRAVLRKLSFSPSLLRAAHLQASKMAYPQTWGQRLHGYDQQLRSDERLPLSPPPSDVLVQQECLRRDSGVHLPAGSQEAMMRYPSHMSSPYHANMFAQPATKQQQHLSESGSAALATSTPPSGDGLYQPPHTTEPQQMSAWHADALAVSGLSFTPEMNGQDGQTWWSSSSSVPTRATHASPDSYLMPSLQPKQTAIQNISNHADFMQGGLMIQFDSPFDFASGDSSLSTPAPGLHSTSSATHLPAAQQASSTPSSSFSRTPYMATPQSFPTTPPTPRAVGFPIALSIHVAEGQEPELAEDARSREDFHPPPPHA